MLNLLHLPASVLSVQDRDTKPLLCSRKKAAKLLLWVEGNPKHSRIHGKRPAPCCTRSLKTPLLSKGKSEAVLWDSSGF